MSFYLCDVPTDDGVRPLRRNVALATGAVYNSGIVVAPKAARKIGNCADAPSKTVMRVEALRAVCGEDNLALAAAAIRFRMRYPAVICMLIGANMPAQLRQNVDWFNTGLPEAFWADVDDAPEKSKTKDRRTTC